MSKYKIKMNGKEYEMEVELMNEVTASVRTAPASAPSAAAVKGSSSAASVSDGAVVSPMPGTILKVNAAAGQAVKAGDSVLILEAMKMENDITAPKDGVIKSIIVAQGQTVAKDDILFEVE